MTSLSQRRLWNNPESGRICVVPSRFLHLPVRLSKTWPQRPPSLLSLGRSKMNGAFYLSSERLVLPETCKSLGASPLDLEFLPLDTCGNLQRVQAVRMRWCSTRRVPSQSPPSGLSRPFSLFTEISDDFPGHHHDLPAREAQLFGDANAKSEKLSIKMFQQSRPPPATTKSQPPSTHLSK